MYEVNEAHYEAACELLKKDRDLSLYLLKKAIQEQFPEEVINNSSLNLAKDWIDQMRIYINSTEDFLQLLKLYYTNKDQEEIDFGEYKFKTKSILDTLLLAHKEFASTVKLSEQLRWFNKELSKHRFYIKEHGKYTGTTILRGKYLSYNQAYISMKQKEKDSVASLINKRTYEICVE